MLSRMKIARCSPRQTPMPSLRRDTSEQEQRIGRSLKSYGTPASACGMVSAIFCSKQACRCGYDCRPRRPRLLLMFCAASFEPKRNISRLRPQVTLPPQSRLRLLPLLNSHPLDLINVRHRGYRHERRLALHEVALRNRASSALQWPRGRWCVLRLSSLHALRAPLPAALDDRGAQ